MHFSGTSINIAFKVLYIIAIKAVTIIGFLFYIVETNVLDFTYLYNRLNICIIFKVTDYCISVSTYGFIIFSNILHIKTTYSQIRHLFIWSPSYALINFIK